MRGLIRQLMGDMSQGDFAARVGVSEAMISYMLSGQRDPGLVTVRGLIRAFPEKRQQIAETFLADHREREAR